jgi:hypothetical protein
VEGKVEDQEREEKREEEGAGAGEGREEKQVRGGCRSSVGEGLYVLSLCLSPKSSLGLGFLIYEKGAKGNSQLSA